MPQGGNRVSAFCANPWSGLATDPRGPRDAPTNAGRPPRARMARRLARAQANDHGDRRRPPMRLAFAYRPRMVRTQHAPTDPGCHSYHPGPAHRGDTWMAARTWRSQVTREARPEGTLSDQGRPEAVGQVRRGLGAAHRGANCVVPGPGGGGAGRRSVRPRGGSRSPSAVRPGRRDAPRHCRPGPALSAGGPPARPRAPGGAGQVVGVRAHGGVFLVTGRVAGVKDCRPPVELVAERQDQAAPGHVAIPGDRQPPTLWALTTGPSSSSGGDAGTGPPAARLRL